VLDWLRGRPKAPAAGAQELIAQAYAAHHAGRLDEAQAGYRRALEADPGNFDAQYLLGVIALQRARADEARAHFEHAVRLNGASAAAHNGLGEALRRLGRADEALASLRRAVELEPQLGEAQFNLGSLLRQTGRSREAVEALQRAIEINPAFAAAHAGLADALQAAGEPDEALASAQRALALEPASPAHHLRVGNLLREKGYLDEAAAAYRAALEREPRLPEAHNNLGNVLRHQGRTDEALACYERALTVKPDFAAALLNAAQLMRENRRLADAVAAYRLLLEQRPDMAEAHLDLGNALKGMGDARGALEAYARALELDPEYAEARWALAMSQLPLIAQEAAEQAASRAAFDAELEALEGWCAARGAEGAARAVGTQQPFYLAYQEEDHRDRMARYGALCARLMGDWQRATGLPMPARITRAQVRVGIVSAHIRDHSVWNALVKGWLQHLDRERFEVRLFHLGNANDVETALAKTLAAHYTYGRSDLVDWTQQILAQQPDVLIYPEVGMDPLTAKLASLRLAPVQAASWGHPLTTGLPTIDYFISAEALEPPGAEAHYTERLVRLPGLGCCYTPAPPAAGEADLAALGIREDVPLLVCPGVPFKYTPRHDAVLVEIARRLGECQFVFFAPRPPELIARLRARMARAFADAGLELDAYAAFVPWQSRQGFNAILQRAEACLDTLGFSGFNTAMQSIENGLPVVAWEGRFLRGRLASGVLRRMGLDELVAGSEADYVETTVRLARDAAYWGDMRERLAAARTGLYGDLECVRALEAFLARALSPA
jgi:predicted O-linked N-acetylglucosamine transferase (SPINDLY family)